MSKDQKDAEDEIKVRKENLQQDIKAVIQRHTDIWVKAEPPEFYLPGQDADEPGPARRHFVFARDRIYKTMADRMLQLGCQLCDDSTCPNEDADNANLLFYLRPGVRCPCLVAAERPRLVVVCLSNERYPTAPNSGSANSREFTDFWATAHAYFRIELRCVSKLTQEVLRDAHIAWLDPCLCHPKMGLDEIAEVSAFVNQGGGTLVANGFSSFSPTNSNSEEAFGSLFKSELMGIKTFKRDSFRPFFCYDDPALFPDAPLLFNGPFGLVEEFSNTGESRFGITAEADALGAVYMKGNLDVAESVSRRKTAFAYYPPFHKHPRTGQVRSGQMLCFGNMHWAVGEYSWSGGSFKENMVFACNLLASAVALADSARNRTSIPKVRPLKEICRMRVRRLLCKGTLGKRLSELEIPEDLRAHLVGIPEYLSALKFSRTKVQECPSINGASFLIKEVFTSYGQINRCFFMKGGSITVNQEGSAFRWFAPSPGACPDDEQEEFTCEKLVYQHEQVEEGGWRRIEFPLCLRRGCGCHLCYPHNFHRGAFRISPDDKDVVEMILNEDDFLELPEDRNTWWKPWEHQVPGRFICYRLQKECV